MSEHIEHAAFTIKQYKLFITFMLIQYRYIYMANWRSCLVYRHDDSVKHLIFLLENVKLFL